MRATIGFIAVLALATAASAGAQTVYSAPPGYHRGNDRGPTIVCESQDGHYNRCQIPWEGGVQIVEQISGSACVRGQTWGARHHSVWVNQGCRARFAPAGMVEGGWAPPPDWNQRFGVSCGSRDYHYNFCQVDIGGHGRAFLQRQVSGAACIEGSTWGWNRAGIWVDRGCAGNFVVDRRW
jgi:hypothetical protein